MRSRRYEKRIRMKEFKRSKLPVIRQISTRNVMYNMINIANTAVS